MSEINVVSRTQIINVEPTSAAISVINAGPAGPGGAQGTSTGTIILPGTSPPLPSDGAVGNFWLDLTADILYGPKRSTAPVWPIALYGAQTPPVLLGDNYTIVPPVFSSNMLPVNIDIPAITRLKVALNLHVQIFTDAVYAFECRLDGTVVQRFAYPVAGHHFINAEVMIPSVPAGQHTISAYPVRQAGSATPPSFYASSTLPAYLSVYKDTV